MNRSLILVMCDVLVLSAMSLSSGAFDDSEDDGMRNGVPEMHPDSVILTSVESSLVATNAPSETSAQQEELAAAVSNLAYQLNCATSELAKTARDFGKATNDIVQLQRLADSHSNEVARMMLDVEAAREEAQALATARDRAETERKSAEEARRKAEEEAEVANTSLAAAREEAQALATARDRAETERKSAEEARRKAEEEAEVANTSLAAAREEAQALATARDRAETERKQAEEQGEGWKMKYDGVYRKYELPELERKKRVDTIRHSIVLVQIEKDNREMKTFYSPIVGIESSRYILALLDEDDLKKAKRGRFETRVLPGEYGTVVTGFVKRVQRMRWGNKKLAFLQIQEAEAQDMRSLSLGVEDGRKSDRKYIFRPQDGEIKSPELVIGGAWRVAKKIWEYKSGDFVVDEASVAIEKIYYSGGLRVLEFDHPLKMDELDDGIEFGRQ